MKAITLWQPWASLVALGVKTIETRSWPAPKALIGQRIAIHASKRKPTTVSLWIESALSKAGQRYYVINNERHHKVTVVSGLPLGAVVATALLVDCVPMLNADELVPASHDTTRDALFIEGVNKLWLDHSFTVDRSDQLPYGDFAPGRWAWLLADTEQIDPTPAIGRQGIWNWKP